MDKKYLEGRDIGGLFGKKLEVESLKRGCLWSEKETQKRKKNFEANFGDRGKERKEVNWKPMSKATKMPNNFNRMVNSYRGKFATDAEWKKYWGNKMVTNNNSHFAINEYAFNFEDFGDQKSGKFYREN